MWMPSVFRDEHIDFPNKHASWVKMFEKAAGLLDPKSMGSCRKTLDEKGLHLALRHDFTKASADVLNGFGYKVKVHDIVPADDVDGIQEVN